MTIRLRQLEAFRAVSQLGSVTLAARQLEISQPAVSRLLASFSDSVGFRLFERKGGRLVPTQESRYLLREVGRLLDSLDHIDQLTRDLSARKAGHLRIACLPGFATSHLPAVLARFLRNRPGVTVTLEPDRPERILEWIIGEQYDCGITDGFEGHPAVDCEVIRMRTVCIMPRGHRLEAKPEIWPEDLAAERMIHTRRDSAFFRELADAFAARKVQIDSLIETRQFTAACMLVAEGAGVSVVSEMDARGYADRGLALRPFRPSVPHRLALLRPTHARASMITLEFLETFADSLAPFREDAQAGG
ncbi:LysR substrate-binding domain-containing protein [Limibaculum sp. FT325]|uniref:LysR substrate-binding domain-containing protein n=1 Tax=Thermohalobaculum sediminis TaxID=2939436 RepID=UPI0020C13A8E|nr:LysR substrate-binding domain-containing protein [Limibaculum sediminis]MCL5776846.1 LysR substrate-binding domain-containing protein [Limibaculum sediminis]